MLLSLNFFDQGDSFSSLRAGIIDSSENLLHNPAREIFTLAENLTFPVTR